MARTANGSYARDKPSWSRQVAGSRNMRGRSRTRDIHRVETRPICAVVSSKPRVISFCGRLTRHISPRILCVKCVFWRERTDTTLGRIRKPSRIRHSVVGSYSAARYYAFVEARSLRLEQIAVRHLIRFPVGSPILEPLFLSCVSCAQVPAAP